MAYNSASAPSNRDILSPDSFISLNSLIKGLGVGADEAYLMSKNLTQLVYDLASFKNLDIETSFRKIQSAMSGEIEPLTLVAIICEYYRKEFN